MFSIYTSLFNLSNGFIDWEEALENFSSFADEVCVGTTACTEPFGKDAEILREYAKSRPKIKIQCTDFELSSLDFDGKIKNAALSRCTKPFCILLDGDERVRVNDRPLWEKWAEILKTSIYDGFFIPVVDLYNTKREYKSVGQKWYLHKNLPHLRRGVVNFAKKENGKINVNRSDTCELITDEGNLSNCLNILPELTISNVHKLGFCVYHLGWLDKEKRLKSNAFWQPVWNNRAGEEIKNIIHSKEKLDKIEYFEHRLKLWDE